MDNSELDRPSVHQQHAETFGAQPAAEALEAPVALLPPASPNARRTHQIYGWQPHWREAALPGYRWDLLSSAAYFSYEVDPATGKPKTLHRWKTTNLFDHAGDQTQVDLTATLFGRSSNRQLLHNEAAVETLIAELAALSSERSAGVCIDFESIASGEKDALSAFFEKLRPAVTTGEVTVALPAVDWSKAFDIPRLNEAVDRFVIMAYDYHWSTADQAGPVSPLRSSSTWGGLCVEASIDRYLRDGVPPEKLLAGLPYYGYQWPTESADVPSSATSRAKSLPYSAIRRTHASDPLYDDASDSAHYRLDGPEQLWFDSARSFEAKCELVKSKGIAGIGIWALGYDSGFVDLWQVLERQFTSEAPVT